MTRTVPNYFPLNKSYACLSLLSPPAFPSTLISPPIPPKSYQNLFVLNDSILSGQQLTKMSWQLHASFIKEAQAEGQKALSTW